MIINRVNVEGICNKEDLQEIYLEDSQIFSKDFLFTISENNPISEIIEALLATELLTFKPLYFKDKRAASITLITEVNLLLEEKAEGRLLRVKEDIIANHVMPIKNYTEKGNIQLRVIDCSFNLIRGRKIMGFITYLIKENSTAPFFGEEIMEVKERYEAIDVLQEFP